MRGALMYHVWEVGCMVFFVYWAAAFAAQPGGLEEHDSNAASNKEKRE